MNLRRYYESDFITSEYYKFRPTYNNEIRDIILEYLKQVTGKSPPHQLMVDVGCGSGQATNLMAPYFKKVLASDISENQIRIGKAQNKFDHVTYSVGRAEEIDVEDRSVDLLLSATAAHWFDLSQFFKESSRILKPDGVLAVIGYCIPRVTPITSKNITSDLTDFCTKLLKKWMLFGEKFDRDGYDQSFSKYSKIFSSIPTQKKQRCEVALVYEQKPLSYLKGRMRSSDCVQAYREFKANEIKEQNGNVTEEDLKPFDVTEHFGTEVKQKLCLEKSHDDEIKFNVVHDVSIVMAHKIMLDE